MTSSGTTPLEALKICVIGAGSTYTPELVEGLIDRGDSLPLGELALVDINPERLEVLGQMARRMFRAAGREVLVTTSEDRRPAIDGADFVLNQIRVGGQAARIRDEKWGRRHGVIGQETTGPGGFAKALRTIPVALAIAADIRELSPRAWMINFTNPAGMVTESLLRHGGIRVVGLCNSPYGLQVEVAKALGVEPARVRLDVVGLNHLSWVRTVFRDGEDVTPEVIGRMASAARDDSDWFDADLIEALGMIPSGYLRYFYHQERVLEEQRRGGKTRGEQVWEIEQELLAMYRDPQLCCKPPLLARRGGAHYSTLAVSLVAAIANDSREVHIVDCRNADALPDLPPEVAVEIPAVVDRQGAHAIAAGHLPFSIRGLVQHVKAYEELTIEAAITGDQRAALLALTANPLVPSFETARSLLRAMSSEP
ncbi:MAG: 6-phospho-beta-glucosidase [Chloroflexi bacterium]|nr:6-phospho-beta-glucosidase [Chloroflexota bacterium]